MVLIGLGSNQGQSLDIIGAALDELQQFALAGTFVSSSLWRTSPVDCPPGVEDFVNAVVGFMPRVGLTPESLLAELKTLERRYGRKKVYVKNAPRELDLDLLVFGQHTRHTPDFMLPHPRATQRLFVLKPAAEVAPDLHWPGEWQATEGQTGESQRGPERTIAQLLFELESDELTDEQVTPISRPDAARCCE